MNASAPAEPIRKGTPFVFRFLAPSADMDENHHISALGGRPLRLPVAIIDSFCS